MRLIMFVSKNGVKLIRSTKLDSDHRNARKQTDKEIYFVVQYDLEFIVFRSQAPQLYATTYKLSLACMSRR